MRAGGGGVYLGTHPFYAVLQGFSDSALYADLASHSSIALHKKSRARLPAKNAKQDCLRIPAEAMLVCNPRDGPRTKASASG